MRLGLLGPSNGDLAALARTAEFLLNGAKVTRAIYLGADDAIEETVGAWAESLVGPDPSDEGIWARALGVIKSGSAEQIDVFLRAEHARLRLRALERLSGEKLCSAEMFGDHLAVLIHDKAQLDEEDIFSASFLLYGKSDAPLVKKIGPRWFLTPGPIGSAGGGAAVLDDSGDQVLATIYDAAGKESQSQSLSARTAAMMSIKG